MADEESQATPGDAFGLLGHQLRLDIVLAMLEGWEAAETEPQRYSELMRAVGVEDSGKFNYHLDKLRGAYLQKVDGGYVPTASATALYRAVLAHRPTAATRRSELTLETECPVCGSNPVGVYERQFLTLQCEACRATLTEFSYPLPENALDGRTGEAVFEATYDRARAEIGLARRGQCPDCAGHTATTVVLDDLDGKEPRVEIGCHTCSWHVHSGVVLPLLSDARFAGALVEAGAAVEEAYPWELPDAETSVRSREPTELTVVVDCEDGTVSAVVDANLRVDSVS